MYGGGSPSPGRPTTTTTTVCRWLSLNEPPNPPVSRHVGSTVACVGYILRADRALQQTPHSTPSQSPPPSPDGLFIRVAFACREGGWRWDKSTPSNLLSCGRAVLKITGGIARAAGQPTGDEGTGKKKTLTGTRHSVISMVGFVVLGFLSPAGADQDANLRLAPGES